MEINMAEAVEVDRSGVKWQVWGVRAVKVEQSHVGRDARWI
jgi:hypothetical protein